MNAATSSRTSGAGTTFGIALPVKNDTKPGAIVPPGLSMINSVTPCTMNMDDRVTTIDCIRTTATKNPLNAPTSAPSASATPKNATCDSPDVPIALASTALIRDTTAPVERSNPPVSTTMV